ncbi:hypothetical protein IW262DRAFT_1303033 [Armillaria fumosa]|nr:hypothetical protein IW262DRAFT_1303033 [Armillaria fumosa]
MPKKFSPSICKTTYVEDSSCKNLLSEESPAAWKAFKHEASSNRASTCLYTNSNQILRQNLLNLSETTSTIGHLHKFSTSLQEEGGESPYRSSEEDCDSPFRKAVAPRACPRVIRSRRRQRHPRTSYRDLYLPAGCTIVMRKGGTYVHNHYRSGEDMGGNCRVPACQADVKLNKNGLAVNGSPLGPMQPVWLVKSVMLNDAVVKPVKGKRDIIFCPNIPKEHKLRVWSALPSDYQKTGISCMEKAVNVVFCGLHPFRPPLTVSGVAQLAPTGPKWAIQRGTWRGKLALKRNQPVSTFEKYDDIPIEVTGASIPEPVVAFTSPPLDPVPLEKCCTPGLSACPGSSPLPVGLSSSIHECSTQSKFSWARTEPLELDVE